MKRKNKIITYTNIQGFSIVEFMIAATIGLILTAGLITVFETTSQMNRAQNGLARLQENGRFAVMSIKQNLEQAGYQYCANSSANENERFNSAIKPTPWVVFSNTLSPGMPTRSDVVQTPAAGSAPSPYLVDTAYFIHGHECTSGTCTPALGSVGSATSLTIPSVGTADGSRVAGTDVLTFRYVSGSGKEVQNMSTSSGVVTINFTPWEINNNPTPAVGLNQVLVASCDRPAYVMNLQSISSNQATANIATSINSNSGSLSKMFDMRTAFSEITYYVENNKINGRDVPTLFSVVNGTKNALIEGVDRFDVLYGVQTENNNGNVKILDAAGVENLPLIECTPASAVANGTATETVLSNTVGCGWRSVVSIEVHLLLNTIYDSSIRTDEPYVYSIDGNSYESPTDLISNIEHYRMYRREFYTSLTLKNY
jgi:type IV pilus assembly protein PilW